MKWVNNYSPAQPSPGSPPSHKYIVPALYWSWTWNDLRIWYFIVPKLLLLSCSSCSPSCPLATVDCSYIIAACPPATLHSSKSQRMSTGIRIVEVVKGRKDSFNILYIWIDNRYCYLVRGHSQMTSQHLTTNSNLKSWRKLTRRDQGSSEKMMNDEKSNDSRESI